jgi:hypothetical protein
MKILILIMCLLTLDRVKAQDDHDPRFLRSHENIRIPFNLPIVVTDQGKVQPLNSAVGDIFFTPLFQVNFQRTTIHYIDPVYQDELSFKNLSEDLSWIEVKKSRYEFGMGISSILKEGMRFGLIPFKGSMNTMIRAKKSKTDRTPAPKLPSKLIEIERWGVGDYGTFQTYGGVTIQAGFSPTGINLARGSIGIQNQFEVEVLRFSETGVAFKVSEENHKKRQLTLGPIVFHATASSYYAKRFIYDFRLDLNNPEHHQLYQQAINGNIKVLQEVLPHSQQMLSWVGKDQSLYFGIPSVIGRSLYRGAFEMDDNGTEVELDIRVVKNRGLLLPLRVHQKFVYNINNRIFLFWFSEMKRVKRKVFERTFLKTGRSLGLAGFSNDIPENAHFGEFIGQISLSFGKDQIDDMKSLDSKNIDQDYKKRCVELSLSCAKNKYRKRMIARFLKSLTSSIDEISQDLGIVLVNEPALTYSLIKNLKLEKRAFFKFLSSQYQSLQGAPIIEI